MVLKYLLSLYLNICKRLLLESAITRLPLLSKANPVGSLNSSLDEPLLPNEFKKVNSFDFNIENSSHYFLKSNTFAIELSELAAIRVER